MKPRRVTMSPRPEMPLSADVWVKQPGDHSIASAPKKEYVYTARLTIDVTPELRSRIKLAAFRRRITVADLLRTLLEREIPLDHGSPTGEP